jgi:TatD DNase family protein
MVDGPFMSPEPFRGKVCHSGYIPQIASKIAELHNVDVVKVYEITSRNAASLFGVR